MSDDLQAEIDRTREHLAETVDALHDKAVETGKSSAKIAAAVAVVAVVALVLWRRR